MEYMAGFITVFFVTVLIIWRLLKPSNLKQAPEAGRSSPTAPRSVPETYRDHVQKWEPYARKYGRKFGIPWQILAGIIWTESTGDPTETGSAGEVGLMQLKKNQAVEDVRKFTNVDVTGWASNPEKNVEVGAAYLSINLRSGRANGDLYLALRMYNQGPSGAYINALKSRRYADKVINRARKIGYNE